jgi:hypothetical protein
MRAIALRDKTRLSGVEFHREKLGQEEYRVETRGGKIKEFYREISRERIYMEKRQLYALRNYELSIRIARRLRFSLEFYRRTLQYFL